MRMKNNWKEIGALGCIFLATASFVSATSKCKYITAAKLLDTPGMLGNDVSDLVISECQLDRLPPNLRQILPLKIKRLVLKLSAMVESSPAERGIHSADPCTRIKELDLRKSPGSPAVFEWINLFFPSIIKLTIGTEALPMQNDKDIAACREKSLKMESVRYLVIDGSEKVDPPVFANLSLFPQLKTIRFDHIQATTLKGCKDAEDLVFPSVECLQAGKAPTDRLFLSRVPHIFPQLKRMSIHMDAYEELTREIDKEEIEIAHKALAEETSEEARREIRNSICDISPYALLEKVVIFCPIRNQEAVCLGKKAADTFPSLLEVTLHNFSELYIASSDKEGLKPLLKVRAVTIYGRADSGLLPEFLDQAFPNLESLSMVGCDLRQLSNNKATPYGICFPHANLKHLDISRNPGLSETLKMMKPGQPAPHAALESKILSCTEAAHPEVPLGGLYLPSLVTLDICGSFVGQFPPYFFQACPRIKKLRMTVNPSLTDNTPEWWEFLKALPDLETLEVEIDPCHVSVSAVYPLLSSQKFSGNTLHSVFTGLTETLNQVGKHWKNPPTVTFIKPGSTFPITAHDLLPSVLREFGERIPLSAFTTG